MLKNGLIVRSELFRYHQVIGDPTTQLERYNQWAADELIYLDISTEQGYDVRRSDAKISTLGKRTVLEIIAEVSKVCFMPLTFGGGIRSIDDMHERFARGADKVTINTLAIEDPVSITRAAKAFGSQAIVVSIDARMLPDGSYEVLKGGRIRTGIEVTSWAREAEERGAGELLLNSVDRDGTGKGYDISLVRAVVGATGIPVIAIGGAGRWQHFVEVIRDAGASAAAAANIFHFTELSYKNAKYHMAENGIPLRLPYEKFVNRG